jgi:hypothetical protein
MMASRQRAEPTGCKKPGSCDPHGLGFSKGALIGCDAGHHPGWPDKDGPGVGWIFRIEMI